jgi:hypothetical protein
MQMLTYLPVFEEANPSPCWTALGLPYAKEVIISAAQSVTAARINSDDGLLDDTATADCSVGVVPILYVQSMRLFILITWHKPGLRMFSAWGMPVSFSPVTSEMKSPT